MVKFPPLYLSLPRSFHLVVGFSKLNPFGFRVAPSGRKVELAFMYPKMPSFVMNMSWPPGIIDPREIGPPTSSPWITV